MTYLWFRFSAIVAIKDATVTLWRLLYINFVEEKGFLYNIKFTLFLAFNIPNKIYQ